MGGCRVSVDVRVVTFLRRYVRCEIVSFFIVTANEEAYVVVIFQRAESFRCESIDNLGRGNEYRVTAFDGADTGESE